MKKSYFCLAIATAILAPQAGAVTVINYPDFSDVSGLQLNGVAAQVGDVLRLTPAATSQAGSAFSTTSVPLNSEVSFSTAFSFRLSEPGGIIEADGTGADGFVFVVQTNSNDVGGAGGGIGYSGIPNSVGVEFDSWNNGAGLGDPDGNHVAINVEGALNPNLGVAPVTPRINDGDIWYAWVDYDGPSDDLEVRLSMNSARPATPILDTMVDLTTVLGSTDAFVGFTSGTGGAFNNHDILSWEFRDDFEPIVPPAAGVPDPGSSLFLFALSVLGLAAFGKKVSRGDKF